jgi:cytochrome c oxidase subunit 2
MDAHDFETWLTHQDGGGTLAARGANLFRQLGCAGCHGDDSTIRAPKLASLYGKPVSLDDGTHVVADEAYLHDAIVKPRSRIVAGYDPVMPSYAGKVSEDDLVALVAYIKSLAGKAASP